MTLAWMAYLTIVSGLAASAGLAAERALRLYRRPSRWVWIAAIALSVGLPAVAWLWPHVTGGGVPPAGSALSLPGLVVGGARALQEIASGPGAPAWPTRLDGVLLGFWGIAVAAAVGHLTRSGLRLRRERRGWSRATVDGQPVLLSEDRGPAVVGFLSGEIVLPRWLAELGTEVCRAALLHEREHLRAGDHRFHALGAMAVLLVPWNRFVWWQLRRLRLALECDCDARVLSGGFSPAVYGRSLLHVGARLSRVTWGVAAFAEPKTFLQRRIEILIEKRAGWRVPKAVAATVAAGGLLVLACEAVPPTEPSATIGEAEAVRLSEGGARDSSGRPAFIPYQVPPRLQNAPEVREMLEAAYPPALERSDVGGTVALWMYVDEAGQVGKALVKETSGHPELDEAARRVAATMEFEPALNRDEPTAVWVAQTITFEPRLTAKEGLAYLDRPPEDRPLVVIDGEIQPPSVGVDLDLLGTLDIYQVEIVKGEAARAIYGDEGRNGVIQITTKSAASGTR